MRFTNVYIFHTIMLLSLGYVLSKAVVEQNSEVFSVELDVIRPWEDNCDYYKQMNYSHSSCKNNLFDPESVELENYKNFLYIMKLKIGSDKKEFRVAVDTGSYKLWVFDEDCEDCGDHIQYKPSDSDTYAKVDDEFEINYGKGHVKGKSVKDTVYLTADMEVEGQIFGAVDEVDSLKLPCDGVMGLDMRKYEGELPVFLNAVKAAKIAKPIFGIYIQGGGKKGEITFGGVNKAHLNEEPAVTAKLMSKTRILIKLKKVALGDTEMCKEEDDECKLLIDTGCSIIMGPKAKVEAFNKDTLDTDKARKWEVDCDKKGDFPNLVMTIGDKTLTLEPSHYILEVGDKCFSGIRPKDKAVWQIGDVFLAKFYTEYNLKTDDESVTFYEAK